MLWTFGMLHDTEGDRAQSEDLTVAGRPKRQRSNSSAPQSSESRLIPLASTLPSSATTSGTPQTLGSRSGSGSTSAGMNEVLEAEEATRAHGFARVIALVCFAVAPAVALIGGDPWSTKTCVAALLAMAATSALTWHRTRTALGTRRYDRRLLRFHGWSLALGAVFVEHYCGFFSPVTVVVTLGIYYFGQSVDRVSSWLLPFATIGSYALLATLTAFGVLEDKSLFPATDSSAAAHALAIVACTAILVLSASLARLSRAALHEALDASRDAVLLAQQRAAQLAEANHQLDRALCVAVGKPGRHTGQVAGDHTLGVVIGVGAIGEVYEASHVESGDAVAVKLLQVDALERPDLTERFLREGAIVRLLDSPHVTRVIAVGRLSDGAPFLSMELLRGRDLATRLRQEGKLAMPEVVRLAQHMAAALECAHAAGVVHRDLKPLNVYEAEQPEGGTLFKVLDFGISKLESSTGTLTQHGVIGTPGYMSPEQARGAEVDHRSDVFSMGVVLYRAASGQPAFTGDSTPQILFDIVYKNPTRPSLVARELPRDVDYVLALALAKDPKQRIQSARELASAIADAAHGQLSSELRSRGHACLRKHPWGKSLADMARANV